MRVALPGGVLVLDKPRGPTSHDVVGRVRKALRTREVGHAGTLDPMATGVLVVAVGDATKLVPWLTAHDKTYEATIALGTETDTLDAEGQTLRSAPLPTPLLEALAAFASCQDKLGTAQTSGSCAPSRFGAGPAGTIAPLLQAALDAEMARVAQVPPAFSAIHQDGVRAHVRARRGETVDLPPRPVRVARLEILACTVDPPTLSVSLDVDKGYYVRSLARDLAAQLGTFGHLTALRRVRSGCFEAAEATSIDRPADEIAASLVPLAQAAARALPVRRLTERGVVDARHGRPVHAEDLEDGAPGPCAWLDPGGQLVAVGELRPDGRGQVLRGF